VTTLKRTRPLVNPSIGDLGSGTAPVDSNRRSPSEAHFADFAILTLQPKHASAHDAQYSPESLENAAGPAVAVERGDIASTCSKSRAAVRDT
jgi:hypothetical protein